VILNPRVNRRRKQAAQLAAAGVDTPVTETADAGTPSRVPLTEKDRPHTNV